MGADDPRAVLLGMLRHERGLDPEAIARLCDGARFAPAPLTDDEHARLRAASLEGAPPHVLGDYPEWLDDKLAATFGDDRAAEGAALSSRAPLDLRVNTLKGERKAAADALANTIRRKHAGRRGVCASASRPTPKAPRSMPSPPSSKARSKSRTRARSLPRCSPVQSAANR